MKTLKIFLAVTILAAAASVSSALSAPVQMKRSDRKAVSGPGRALTPRQIAAVVYPSTVSIYVSAGSGSVYAGSGFVIGPELVATCFHVVSQNGRITVADRESQWPASIYKYDKGSDLSILKVPNLHKPAITLSRRADYYVGDPIYTVGDPSGIRGVFSNGIASNFMQIDDVFYIQFTAPVSPGSSGGPVINDRGEVAGIVNMQMKEGQNLNFAVMVIHLRALLEGKTVGQGSYVDDKIQP